MKKKLLAILLSVMMALSFFPATVFAAPSDETPSVTANDNVDEHGLAKEISNGAILHTWCWSFNTIKTNMQDIAASGFSAIQVSPIMLCRVGGGGAMTLANWYYHYQATDYIIGNYQLGTKDQFKEMCDVAHSYGIKVIVDTVINHMTSSENSIAAYLRVTSSEQFPNGFLRRPRNTNWSQNNRYEETQAELSSLRELYTQDPAVQQYIKNFLMDCVAAGADGFRYDAAKLIELPDDTPYTLNGVTYDYASNFWPVALDNGSTFQYAEDLQEGGYDATSSRLAAYQKLFSATTASFYGWALRDEMISKKNVSVDLVRDWRVNTPQKDHQNIVWKDKESQPGDADYVDVQKLVTWVESHDSYCNDASYRVLNDQQVILAWAIIGARDGGTPLFFSRPMNATSQNLWGNNVLGAVGSNMFKDPQVTAVNFFRNEMGGAPEYLSNPNGNTQVIMIERGTKGCVIINAGDSDVVLDGASVTAMADGVYPDQASSSSFTVTNGKIYGTVKAGRVAVPYVRESVSLPFAPSISVSPGSSEFLTESVTATFAVKGCDSAYYQINDGAEVPFQDGDTVVVGQSLAANESVTIKATGISGSQTVTASATYTKRVPKGTTIVYFESGAYPAWTRVNLYAYGTATNAGWPGLPMENIGGGIYRYVLPYALENQTSNVIFNNGGSGSGNQYPTGAGLVLQADTQMIYTAGRQWVRFDKAFVEAVYNALKAKDPALYTTDSWALAAAALSAAEVVLAGEAISPDALMDIYKQLSAADKALALRASEADLAKLIALIDAVKDYAASDYTAESWPTFAQALADARTVLTGDLANTSAASVDAAYNALSAAVDALESVLSFGVTTPALVATLAANLVVTVAGENLAGKTLTASIDVGETSYSAAVVGGKGIIKIPANPDFVAGDYTVTVTVSGAKAGSCTVKVVPYNTDIWSCNAQILDNKLLIHFNDDITLKSGVNAVTVAGKLYSAAVLSDLRTVEVFNVEIFKLDTADSIVIKGVKYPALFPSYSFTFTCQLLGSTEG